MVKRQLNPDAIATVNGLIPLAVEHADRVVEESETLTVAEHSTEWSHQYHKKMDELAKAEGVRV